MIIYNNVPGINPEILRFARDDSEAVNLKFY